MRRLRGASWAMAPSWSAEHRLAEFHQHERTGRGQRRQRKHGKSGVEIPAQATPLIAGAHGEKLRGFQLEYEQDERESASGPTPPAISTLRQPA